MILLLSTVVLSLVLCGLYLRLAQRWRILDRPNERSSHKRPTPHGGGVPLLLAFVASFLLSSPWSFEYNWLVAMTFALMLLGISDDLWDLSVVLRFAVYAMVSISSAVVLLQSVTPIASSLGLIPLFGLSFAILWALNLYNFMDGIDGLAASQCVLACIGAAALAFSSPEGGDYTLFCLLFAAAQLGFLCWNWAPARLFMGDAGSIPTGFLLAALAGYGAVHGIVSFATWSILLAVFITDASYTLIWRMATGQNISRPHRLHAYQRLSRHWNSHRAVVHLLLGLNILWLFPIAWAVQLWPEHTVYFVILAYFPLLIGMAKAGKLT
ncbi:MAG: glycosyltransferase family 4 protein [Halioglobus sp.]